MISLLALKVSLPLYDWTDSLLHLWNNLLKISLANLHTWSPASKSQISAVDNMQDHVLLFTDLRTGSSESSCLLKTGEVLTVLSSVLNMFLRRGSSVLYVFTGIRKTWDTSEGGEKGIFSLSYIQKIGIFITRNSEIFSFNKGNIPFAAEHFS